MKVNKVWSSFKKYQRLGLLDRNPSCLLSPTRCFSSPRIWDSDSEESYDRVVVAPCDVPPEGYLAVYVGPGRLRFLMKTDYLNHPLFKELLEKSEEEFGFHHDGGLTIHCEVEAFENLMWRLARAEQNS